MRILALFVPAALRRLSREVDSASESIERLEIAVRRQQLRNDELSSDVQRLSERLCRTEGRLGGRPRTKAAADGSAPYERLEDIPKGDKAALRAWFAIHPPKKDQENVQ